MTFVVNLVSKPYSKAQNQLGDGNADEFNMNLFFRDKIYAVIEYIPKITLMELLIDMFNIWNLLAWYKFKNHHFHTIKYIKENC